MAIGDQHPAMMAGVAELTGNRDSRRADLLLKCAQLVHGQQEVALVLQSIAELVQQSYEARMVGVLARRDDEFRVESLATADTQLREALHASSTECGFVHEVAARAISTGETIAIAVSGLERGVPSMLG